jgi:hypothetical protein
MDDVREIELNGTKLRVYSCGKIESFHHNKWRESNGVKRNTGYYRIQINYKHYLKHRVIGFAFLGLDIDNPNQQIDHIDRVRHNNNVSNLRIVTSQQNKFNVGAKGYTWDKATNKWLAHIKINNKCIHLGRFATEDEARKAYLLAKEKYHII